MSLFKKKKQHDNEKQIVDKRVIAVWGSPYSGKTTIATKLAVSLTQKEKNVAILYTDFRIPTLPMIVDKSAFEQAPFSVGELLQLESVTEDMITEKTNLVHNEYLGIYGYKFGENEYSYPDISKEQTKNFLEKLITLYDYVIVDCTSILSTNIVSATAMLDADIILNVSDISNKSVVFFASNKNVIDNPALRGKKQINVINKYTNIELEEYDFRNGSKILLPYTKELVEQSDLSNQFKHLEYKQSKKFKENFKLIIDEVIYV